MVGLPALDIFEGRALAQALPKKVYSALILQQNGAVQGVNGEPDRFWPTLTGPIDAKSSYELDGQTVNYDGAVQLAQAIAESQQGHACYARRWTEYLYGRDVDPANQADADLVANAGAISRTNPSAKNLILNLVTTESFVTRLP